MPDHKREIERLEQMKLIPQAREAHRKLVSSLERVVDVASVSIFQLATMAYMATFA